MTQPQKLSTLESRWLDALVSAKHVLRIDQVRELWNTTTLVEAARFLAYQPEAKTDIGRIILVRPISDLPEIEARELLLYVAARRLTDLQLFGSWSGFQDLCIRLGCLPENVHTVSERWRQLHFRRNLAELPYAGLEDRPQCKICSGRVATGAGWTPSADAVVFNPDLGVYRPDLHHECKNFALTVLLPQHRAAAAERAKQESARIDK
jgi:hypothetical protein